MSFEAVFVYPDLLDLKNQARTFSGLANSNQANDASCFFNRFAR